MGWLESRILLAEQRIEMLYRRLVGDEGILNNVRQQLRGAFQQLPSGGGGGQQTIYLAATLSGALAHGSSIASQTVWKLSGGGRTVVVTAAATIYNDGPTASNDIAIGKTVIVLPNDDGTFTAVGVFC